jgi:hypothetical protein
MASHKGETMDNVMVSVVTGMSPFTPDAFSKAVAARFEQIKGTEAFAHRDATHPSVRFGFCYDGNRTRPENIGWRASQTVGFDMSPEQIEAGEYDEAIAIGYHEAADSEYYYRYEKDWGWD